MKKISFVVFSFGCMLLIKTSAQASDFSFPLTKEEVQQKVSTYDSGVRVEEDDEWLENQKVFSLFDENQNQIALMDSIGKEKKGRISFNLIEKDSSISSFYDEKYEYVLEFVLELFGIKCEDDETWEDKIEFLESEGVNINIHFPARKEAVALQIQVYNSQEYSPFRNQTEKTTEILLEDQLSKEITDK